VYCFLQEIHQLRAAELHEAVSQGVMLLTLELPVFPHAVLYQQSLSAAAVVAQAAAAPGAASAVAGAAGAASGAEIIRFQDPEVRCCLVVPAVRPSLHVLLVVLAAALLSATRQCAWVSGKQWVLTAACAVQHS
jgi:hypothetical protein